MTTTDTPTPKPQRKKRAKKPKPVEGEVVDLTTRPNGPTALAEQSPSIRMADRILDLATNPDFKVETLERLIEMQRTAQRDHAIQVFNAEMAEMQDQLPVIKKEGVIAFKEVRTPFAKIEDILKAITPVLKAHGFSLRFESEDLNDGQIKITTFLQHAAGHTVSSTFQDHPDSSGHKNALQARRSTRSYGRRSGITDVLNIITEGEDDDGGKPRGRREADEVPQEANGDFDKWVETMRQTAMQGTAKLMDAFNDRDPKDRTRLVQLERGDAWREMRRVAGEVSDG